MIFTYIYICTYIYIHFHHNLGFYTLPCLLHIYMYIDNMRICIIYLSIYLSINLSINLSIYLSIYIYIYMQWILWIIFPHPTCGIAPLAEVPHVLPEELTAHLSQRLDEALGPHCDVFVEENHWKNMGQPWKKHGKTRRTCGKFAEHHRKIGKSLGEKCGRLRKIMGSLSLNNLRINMGQPATAGNLEATSCSCGDPGWGWLQVH